MRVTQAQAITVVINHSEVLRENHVDPKHARSFRRLYPSAVDVPWQSWAAERSPGCGTPPYSGCSRTHPSRRTSWTGWQGCRWQPPWRCVCVETLKANKHTDRRVQPKVGNGKSVVTLNGRGGGLTCCDALRCVLTGSRSCVPPTLTITSPQMCLYVRSVFTQKKHRSAEKHLTYPLLPHADGWRYCWFPLCRGDTHHKAAHMYSYRHTNGTDKKKEKRKPSMPVSSKGQNSTDGSTNSFPCVCRRRGLVTAWLSDHFNQMSVSCLSKQ